MPHQPLGFEPTHSVITTFGTLGLNQNPQQNPPNPEWLGTIAEALVNGECDVPADGDFAATCMDDRLRLEDPLLPNLAGGGLGLLFAARAVSPAYDRETLTASRFMNTLAESGLPVYAHIDDKYTLGVATGCAFNDQIAISGEALPFILTEVLDFFDFTVSEESMGLVFDLATRVQSLTEMDQISGQDSFDEDPFSRLEAVKDAGGVIEFYGGPHLAVGADISFRRSLTLSRDTLFQELDAHLFHLDAWSYRYTAIKLARALPRSQAQITAGVEEEDLVWQMATAMFLNSFSALAARSTPDSLLIVRP